eukprot:2992020-Pleurochrysis_carterae.AAC.1
MIALQTTTSINACSVHLAKTQNVAVRRPTAEQPSNLTSRHSHQPALVSWCFALKPIRSTLRND